MGNDASRTTAAERRASRTSATVPVHQYDVAVLAPVFAPVLGTTRFLVERVTNVVLLLRGGLGATSYERYLSDHAAAHPELEPLSERGYWEQRSRVHPADVAA